MARLEFSKEYYFNFLVILVEFGKFAKRTVNEFSSRFPE